MDQGMGQGKGKGKGGASLKPQMLQHLHQPFTLSPLRPHRLNPLPTSCDCPSHSHRQLPTPSKWPPPPSVDPYLNPRSPPPAVVPA